MTAPQPMAEPVRRPILVASNVLINGRDELLMGLRSDCRRWEVPGGKVEAESVVDAARREMMEETGMTLLGDPVSLGFADLWEEWGLNGRQWFVCQLLLWKQWEGFPQLVEGKHLEWRWFPLSDLPQTTSVGTAIFFRDILPGYLGRHYHRESKKA